MHHKDYNIEVRDRVAVFSIDRPAHANALSRHVLLGLGQFARKWGQEVSVRALVVTATGDRHFCAGADLHERMSWSDDDIRVQLELYRSELGALGACPKPVVAAINGVALGGGLEIAMACDLRVAVPHAEFAQPEVRLGIIPGAGGTQRLARLVGETRAKQWILFGTRISAEEALHAGLINRITPAGVSALQDAIDWIAPIVCGAPLAHAAALEAIDASFGMPLGPGLAAEQRAYERVLGSQDRIEGLRAFLEKREPSFQGK